MKRIAVAVLTVVVVFALSGFAVAGEFTIAGSGACQVLLRGLAAEFIKTNPGVKVDVPDSIGTGGGIKAAGEGEVALGRVARELKEKEAVYGLEYLEFAKSPVVFCAHPGVPSQNLTAAQTANIFQGKVDNWKAVGGPDKKLRVIARHAGEASLVALQAQLPGWKDLVFTDKSKMGATDQETSQFIGQYEGAIGFLPLAEARTKGLSVMTLDGNQPTSSSYAVTGPFALVYKPGALTGDVKEFVDYIFSPQGAKIIEANHAIPVNR